MYIKLILHSSIVLAVYVDANLLVCYYSQLSLLFRPLVQTKVSILGCLRFVLPFACSPFWAKESGTGFLLKVQYLGVNNFEGKFFFFPIFPFRFDYLSPFISVFYGSMWWFRTCWMAWKSTFWFKMMNWLITEAWWEALANAAGVPKRGCALSSSLLFGRFGRRETNEPSSITRPCRHCFFAKIKEDAWTWVLAGAKRLYDLLPNTA